MLPAWVHEAELTVASLWYPKEAMQLLIYKEMYSLRKSKHLLLNSMSFFKVSYLQDVYIHLLSKHLQQLLLGNRTMNYLFLWEILGNLEESDKSQGTKIRKKRCKIMNEVMWFLLFAHILACVHTGTQLDINKHMCTHKQISTHTWLGEADFSTSWRKGESTLETVVYRKR